MTGGEGAVGANYPADDGWAGAETDSAAAESSYAAPSLRDRLKDAHKRASEMKIITPPPPPPPTGRVLADDMEQTEPWLQMGFH